MADPIFNAINEVLSLSNYDFKIGLASQKIQ